MNALSPARWVRALRFGLFSVAAVVTLVVLVCSEAGWRGRRDFARLQAELQARGEPTKLSQLEPKRLPDAENFGMVPWLQDLALKDDAQLPPPSLATLRAQLREFEEAFARLGPPGADLARLRQELAPLEPRLTELRAAATSRAGAQFRSFWDHGGRSPDGSPVFDYSRLFDLTMLVQLHAHAAIDVRDHDIALGDLRVMHRLGEAFVHDGTLLAVMISRATSQALIPVIARGRETGLWTAEDFAAFQSWLNRDDLPMAFGRAMRGERIVVTNHLVSDFPTFSGKNRDRSAPASSGSLAPVGCIRPP
jgi:hypothetical protein